MRKLRIQSAFLLLTLAASAAAAQERDFSKVEVGYLSLWSSASTFLG